MVYIQSTRYEDAYRRLQQGAHSTTGGTSVLIFVSMDADALCALRILIALLKRDTIGHKIIPVNNYADITSMNQELIERNMQIKSVVLINCGAQVDIQDYITLRDDLAVLVVDSHRPFNLYNVYWNEQVMCFDDGDVETNMGELRRAFEDIEFGNDDSDDDDSDGGDGGDLEEDTVAEEFDEQLTINGRKRGSDAMLDEPDENAGKGRRRKTGLDPEEFIRIQNERASRRQLRAEYQALIQAYYSQGSYHGQSCAVSMLSLAEQMGQPATPDLVWWAIVGATSQLLLQQIDADGYQLVVKRMKETVRRISLSAAPLLAASSSTSANGSGKRRGSSAPTGASDSLGSSSSSSQPLLDSQLGGFPGTTDGEAQPNGRELGGFPGTTDGEAQPNGRDNASLFNPYLEAIDEEDDEGYLKARAGVSTSAEAGLLTSSKQIAQRTSIHESDELSFALLRHWSLDSAMRYSPFVATRLATWSSRGRARLDLLLAKLGLSKAEAREPYVHLAPELKRQLHARMEEIGADYDMADAKYPGFVRDYGWRKSSVSAADMVLSILALLQRGRSAPEVDGRSGGGGGEAREVEAKQHQVTADGFYAAYDALAQFSVLKAGIGSAMELQRLIVGQGVAMLERRAVKTLRTFRLAMIGDMDGGTSLVFCNGFALRQLALFLMQTLRERSKSAHARLPFVIAAPLAPGSTGEDRLLVLGITPLDYAIAKPQVDKPFSGSLYSGESRNHFGLVFEEVAQQIGAQVRQGFFDSSLLEIRRADMTNFADRLRRHL
ncbi:CDC45-like protein [Martensiomyces pterosporus]|nr:CDC45-like protein [Martensiomyces pterosporus]